jgi:hypothetical protein
MGHRTRIVLTLYDIGTGRSVVVASPVSGAPGSDQSSRTSRMAVASSATPSAMAVWLRMA